jgi:NAD(P)-dependent dehydrogenase (short-subunit alcohol dehydrogenase family)
LTTPTSFPTALITGGTSGIGLATARLLHSQHFRLLVTGRNPDTLAAARRSLPEDVIVHRADAGDLADADRLADEVKRRFGRLDLLFLNAAYARLGPIDELDETVYDKHFDVNVKGHLFTLQKLLPLLGSGASVVFNSSVLAAKGMPNSAVYSATKGAINSLVTALAVELSPRGIRVNAISPGLIETPAHEKSGLTPEAIAGLKDDFRARLPLHRLGTDTDVANLVSFLASPAASYITGANLVVDGGMAAI